MPSIIHSPHFAMGFPGLRFLHPFDSYRARRVHHELARELGFDAQKPGLEVAGVSLRSPEAPVTNEQLQIVHTPEYLASLRRSWVVAVAIEVLPFALTPRRFLDWCLVRPMRWAVSGTLLGAREALRTGLAFSLTGGFHHAKPDRGEGFCLFSDIGYAVRVLQSEGLVHKVVYVDLDAHQGNGLCHVFRDDPGVKLFDVYNGDIYPQEEESTRERLDASFPLESGADDALYWELLQRELPLFLDQHEQADLLIYNAGSDVVEDDRLGGLAISPETILRRDLLVLGEARRRNLPALFLPSGGYTRDSYKLISRTILSALKEWG